MGAALALVPLVEDPDASTDPAQIAEICTTAEQPGAIAAFIRAGLTVGEVRARLDVAGRIRDLVGLAAGWPGIPPGLADEAIIAGRTLAEVRDDIFQRMSAADAATQVDGAHIKPGSTPP